MSGKEDSDNFPSPETGMPRLVGKHVKPSVRIVQAEILAIGISSCFQSSHDTLMYSNCFLAATFTSKLSGKCFDQLACGRF
jgi:hypothetical protein